MAEIKLFKACENRLSIDVVPLSGKQERLETPTALSSRASMQLLDAIMKSERAARDALGIGAEKVKDVDAFGYEKLDESVDEQLCAVYGKPIGFFIDNFDRGTMLAIKAHVVEMLLDTKKN